MATCHKCGKTKLPKRNDGLFWCKRCGAVPGEGHVGRSGEMRRIEMTRRILGIVALLATLAGCGKLGVTGTVSQAFGDWARVNLPAGCVAKQISAEEGSGVAVLCEDGRVFH